MTKPTKEPYSTTNPNPIDIVVGMQMRKRRVMLGITQEEIAEDLGLSFQQVQKYERGVNRISASRLFDIATNFSCAVSYFFEGCKSDMKAADIPESTADERITLELMRHFHSITGESTRRHIYGLVKAVAEEGK